MSNKIFELFDGDVLCYNPETCTWTDLSYGCIEQGVFSKLETKNASIVSNNVKYIIPGFIDAHCHLLENPYPIGYSEEGRSLSSIALNNALVAAQAGVTSLKDMGGYNYKAIEILKMLANFKTPRLFTSGCYFTVPGGHCSDRGAVEVKDYDEFVQKMQPLINSDINFCKIINSDDGFELKLLTKMISYAHCHHMLVSCHAYTQKAAMDAVIAGTDTLEHAGSYSDELLDMIKKKGVIVVPTYVAAVDSTPENCENIVDVDENVIREWIDGENEVIPKLFDRNIKVALGTDSGFLGTPCDSLLREIELLHRMFNIPICQLLYSAFVVTPCTIGMGNRLGKIQNGYFADFLLYDENPLDDINVLLHPKGVWIGGQRVDEALSNKIIIRRLRKEDVSEMSSHMKQYYFDCAELDDFWSDDEVVAWITDEKDYCAGAFLNEKLVGFCLTHHHVTANKVHIENIFVKDKYRGNGIAQCLIFDAISFYRSKYEKVRFVSLVDVTNFGSLALFERNGFTKGHPMHWMQYNSDHVL